MWISPDVRGAGLGRRLLLELERHAARVGGVSVVQLETNRALTEAIALYRATGYREVAPFNDEKYARPLVREAARTRLTLRFPP